ncbi:unnamed protein product [Amaranthus hypochondriacus]
MSEDTKVEALEPVTNGSKSDVKEVETVEGKKENGVKEMEEDKKEENDGEGGDKTVDKVDDGKEIKEDKETNVEEDKEEPKAEAMEEEPSMNEDASDIEMVEKVQVSEENKEEEIEDGDEKVKDKEEAKESEDRKEEGEEEEKDEGKESEKEEKEEEKIKENEEEEEKEEKPSKKRSRSKSTEDMSADKKTKLVQKVQEPKTPTFDRPVRERKSVERLVATIEKDTSRDFHIEKGRGTPLKEIPNVAYKLSRKKTEDTFKLLHMILYGRRGKAAQVKHNISRFSGFVWHDNEEKQRMKVKEKFDKCVKEKLLEFCDVLDIPITKTTTKKEDIVSKLLEFLMAPHATTTELLAEKDQGKKRKRPATKSVTSTSPSSTSSAKVLYFLILHVIF